MRPLADRSAVSSVDRWVRGAGRTLLGEAPSLEPALVVARDRYARARVRARTVANGLRYDAPPEPYRLLRVDPDSITRGVQLDPPKYTQAGLVVGGDWDRDGFPFEDLDVYEAYVRRFEHGVPWSETRFYDRIVQELRAGRVRWGCRTEAAFRDRCDRLDALYDRLRTEGYRSQAELRADGTDDPIRSDRRSRLPTERLKDEIAVHVDRDGEFVFCDGRNRLSMAKLIGLDAVLVRVLRRHSDWQAVRDAYVRGDPRAAEHEPHPDLAPLEFDSVPR